MKLLTKVTDESDEDVESASRVNVWDRDLAIFSKCLDLVPPRVTLRASLAAAVNLCLLGRAGGIVDEDEVTAGAWMGMSLSSSLISMTLKALGLDELALANLLRSDDIFTVWRSIFIWGNGRSAARSAVAPLLISHTLAEVSVGLQRNLSISLWRNLGQRFPTLF